MSARESLKHGAAFSFTANVYIYIYTQGVSLRLKPFHLWRFQLISVFSSVPQDFFLFQTSETSLRETPLVSQFRRFWFSKGSCKGNT